MKNLAPIVLFVYNRPWHTQQTVEALQKNQLVSESELYIYSDAPKNAQAVEKVKEVRDYIRTINGFKEINIIEREKNLGLADSIIDGVTMIVNKYGKVIVLEDDLVTSPYFLKFMNEALEFYKDKKRVWHISGWNYPIKNDNLDDVFLFRVSSCWGWATWSDRWNNYEKNIDKILKNFSKNDIRRFNLEDNENFWGQVLANNAGNINTWAVFWYAIIFKKEGLCLHPTQTFVENIGLDGSGIHCGENNNFKSNLSKNKNIIFNIELQENNIAIDYIKDIYKKKNSIISRIINKIRRLKIT